MRVPETHVARGPVSVQVKNVCVHVWACSWSMHVYGPDTLRVNHGDMGPGTPVRKAALTNLGNQGPETGSLRQILSGERLEKESRPARLGTWATSDSPLCLSTLCRKKRERGCKQGWGTDTRQYTDHTEDTLVPGAPHAFLYLTLSTALEGVPAPFFRQENSEVKSFARRPTAGSWGFQASFVSLCDCPLSD